MGIMSYFLLWVMQDWYHSNVSLYMESYVLAFFAGLKKTEGLCKIRALVSE